MSGHSKALNCFSFIQQTTYGGVLGDTRLSLRLGKYILDYEKIFYFYSAVGGFLVIYPFWFLKDQMVDSGPFQKLSLRCRVTILNTMLAVLIREDLPTKQGAGFVLGE